METLGQLLMVVGLVLAVTGFVKAVSVPSRWMSRKIEVGGPYLVAGVVLVWIGTWLTGR